MCYTVFWIALYDSALGRRMLALSLTVSVAQLVCSLCSRLFSAVVFLSSGHQFCFSAQVLFWSLFLVFSCSVSAGPLDLLGELRDLVESKGAHSLPGCPMVFERFRPVCERAMSRGYVRDRHGRYVLEGFQRGFDLGAERHSLVGKRVFANYPTAVNARASVSKAIRSRLRRHKSVHLGSWASVKDELSKWFDDYFVFPMGAVPKPHSPHVMRPTSDHTRTGFNAATVLGILGHSLDAYKRLEHLLTRGAWLTVADIDDAFSYIPLAPWVWAFMLFRWYAMSEDEDDSTPFVSSALEPLHLFVNLFADFGTRGAPGTFKLIIVDVFIRCAESEFVVTIPCVVYVDDVGLISETEVEGNAQMAALQVWTVEITGLGWQVIKTLAASQCQLYLGFWWKTIDFTRSLPEIKLCSYLQVLLDASKAVSLSLRERQSIAGKMQRGIMTLPPGAACLLVNCYRLMSGLHVSWQQRRTTRAERSDYRFVHDLLRFNQGRGYYSYDGFDIGPEMRSDASKSRDYTGGGWVTQDGHYDFFRFGGSAARKPIDFLEGFVYLEGLAANAHRWSNLFIPAALDNMAFELSLEAGRSRVDRLNDILRGSFVLQLQYNCIVGPYWLGTLENVHADDLSRNREAHFLSIAYDFVHWNGGRLLQRHPEAGRTLTLADNVYANSSRALHQLLRSYRSNDLGDGPTRGAGVGGDAQVLSIPFTWTSIFDGLPPEMLDRLDEIMDMRLRPSSLRKVRAGFARWSTYADERGWPRVLPSGSAGRGGKVCSWIISLIDDTTLVYASIQTYVWGMRSMHVMQHESDPIMGCEFYRELMRSAAVLTAVPGEPRKRIEFDVVKALLQDILDHHWDDRKQVQVGLLTLILLFTFTRSECPCPKNHSGEESWDPKKHWQVRDLSLRRTAQGRWVLWVRFKAIKQDPRIERPEARYADPNLPYDLRGDAKDSKDWKPIGDIPDDLVFSIAHWYMRYVQLVGRARADDEPFFLAADGKRAYTYSAFSGELRRACVANGGTESDQPHGLRVLGYWLSKEANGELLTVVHGNWSEQGGHERYDRFQHENDVLGIPCRMVGLPNIHAIGDGARVPRHGAQRGVRSEPVLPAEEDPTDGSGDESGGDAEPASSSRSDLPPGFSRILHHARSRTYSTFSAPDGTHYRSITGCWRAFARMPVSPRRRRFNLLCESPPPRSPSSSSSEHSGSPSEDPDAAPTRTPVPRRPGRRAAAFREVQSGDVCGTLDPSHEVFCTLRRSHPGLHSWEVVPARRTTRL